MAKFKRGALVKRNAHVGDPLNNWNKPYYRVKKVYRDDISPENDLFDGEIYSHDGKFIGRESECFDGPKKFEPCLTVNDFVVVDAPPWVNTVK